MCGNREIRFVYCNTTKVCPITKFPIQILTKEKNSKLSEVLAKAKKYMYVCLGIHAHMLNKKARVGRKDFLIFYFFLIVICFLYKEHVEHWSQI